MKIIDFQSKSMIFMKIDRNSNKFDGPNHFESNLQIELCRMVPHNNLQSWIFHDFRTSFMICFFCKIIFEKFETPIKFCASPETPEARPRTTPRGRTSLRRNPGTCLYSCHLGYDVWSTTLCKWQKFKVFDRGQSNYLQCYLMLAQPYENFPNDIPLSIH